MNNLHALCKEVILAEMEERGLTVNANDLDGIIENMKQNNALLDMIQATAAKVVSEYETEVGE